MWNSRSLLSISIVLAFVVLFVSALLIHVSERERTRRSLELKDEVVAADHVVVSITVTSVDPVKGLLTARVRLRPYGNLADEGATPKGKLRLFVNNSPGQQLFEFKEGEGITRIEASFALEGDLNRYPFDQYEANMWFFMDMQQQSKNRQVTQIPPHQPTEDDPQDELALDKESLQNNLPVPLSIAVSASTQGIKYAGEVIRNDGFRGTRVHISLKRPITLIRTSITVMCLMMGLALSVLGMVIGAITSTSREKFDFLPLPLSITLIFGLPALRSIQPSVPSVGVLGDYFSFIWAELFVATSAIIMMWTWLLRSRQKSTARTET